MNSTIPCPFFGHIQNDHCADATHPNPHFEFTHSCECHHQPSSATISATDGGSAIAGFAVAAANCAVSVATRALRDVSAACGPLSELVSEATCAVSAVTSRCKDAVLAPTYA